MYLMTAEVDRMHFIGTPPTKTPELYEKYLPYAIALGVEKQWTQQFSTIFEEILRTKASLIKNTTSAKITAGKKYFKLPIENRWSYLEFHR
jgi:hypothetical protein